MCRNFFARREYMCVCVAHLELGRQFLAQENMCCPFSSLMPVSQTKHTWGCLSSFRVCCTGKISEMLDEIWRFTHMCTPWQWPREKGCKNVPWGQIGWKVLFLQIENLKLFGFPFSFHFSFPNTLSSMVYSFSVDKCKDDNWYLF